MSITPETISIVSPDRLQSLYDEAVAELETLSPCLAELEARLTELNRQYQQLRDTKQRLIALTLSLKPLLAGKSTISATLTTEPAEDYRRYPLAIVENPGVNASEFSSDLAFHEGNQRLRQRDSVNYEIYRAIVYQGGIASTENVRQYLIEQQVTQPGSGEGFDTVSLADISARVNYLVKKGLVTIERRGVFRTAYGWVSAARADTG